MGLSLAGSMLLIELRLTDYETQWAMQRSKAGTSTEPNRITQQPQLQELQIK